PLERGDARGEPAALAAGPKTQIDRKGDAGGRDVAEHRRQPLDREAVEPGGVDALPPIGRAVLTENDEQVEIGAGRELAAAELAETHDDRGNEPPGLVARDAVALDERILGEEPAGGERRLGQGRHLA